MSTIEEIAKANHMSVRDVERAVQLENMYDVPLGMQTVTQTSTQQGQTSNVNVEITIHDPITSDISVDPVGYASRKVRFGENIIHDISRNVNPRQDRNVNPRQNGKSAHTTAFVEEMKRIERDVKELESECKIDIRRSSCGDVSAVVVSVAIVILIYIFANIELHKQFRECRDAVVNDLTPGTVVSISTTYVEYDIGNFQKCKIINRGQIAVIGSAYMIYRSNIGTCALDSEHNKCEDDLFYFNFFFSLFGILATFLLMFALVDASPEICKCMCGLMYGTFMTATSMSRIASNVR